MRREWSRLIAMVGAMSVALGSTLAGCSPIPGNALDPVYLKHGTGTGPEPAQTPGSSEPPASSPAKEPTPEQLKSQPLVAKATGTRVWVGRYEDSRGGGDVTFSLVQEASAVSGAWRLRTGGGGVVSGVLEATGRRFRLRMENTAPECPGTFEGWAEIGETTLVGAYHGTDCEGPVSDGWLRLRLK
jgi:hypothetical protein